ncbi:MAG: hypothetical protein GYB33_03395 [Gammaproteobacteria bacterium]|nr:hypothetical protein [Gammaproteobacteria bacterium]
MNGSAESYSFQSQRLALGVSFVDHLRNAEPRHPLRVEIERQLPHITPLPRNRYRFLQEANQLPVALSRHDSGRYSLLYHAGIRPTVTLRIYDPALTFVPRRIQVPLLSLAQVLAIEAAEPVDYFASRSRHITLFPNANYHLSGGETGLRGRVLRNGAVMRWAYVEARSLATNAVITRARANQHGEFLLLLPPHAAPASDLSSTVAVRVNIVGPAAVPVPATPALAEQDPLWDLPLEILPPPAALDTVATGETPPLGFLTALSAVRPVNFAISRILTGREVNDFEFVFP